jgi:surfeit locus 1 family protein
VTDAVSRRAKAGVAIPSLLALTAFAAFIALGTWQLQRKAWKEALISALEQRVAAVPAALPERKDWPSLDPSKDEFLRVKFSAVFVPGEEALVYTGASALRGDSSGPGYWVFAAAQLPAGSKVVVNRGFVPEGRRDPATRSAGELSGSVTMVGAMRWPEARGLFAPADEPDRNLWFVRDQLAIAAAKGWGEVAPFYVELEEPTPPGGLPHPAALKPNLRNEHLQYAITWYGLALVVAVMFVVWLRARRDAVATP